MSQDGTSAAAPELETEPAARARGVRHAFSDRDVAALAFATLRAVMAIAAIATIVRLAGLGGWIAIPIVVVLTLLVAGVFGEMTSRWPLEGSVHAWTRQLVGPRTGLLVAWTYLVSYLLYMAAMSYFDSQRVFFLLGLDTPAHLASSVVTLGLVAVATVLNLLRRDLFRIFIIVSALSSLVACVVFGTILLVGHQQRSIGDLLVDANGAPVDLAWVGGPFLLALLWAAHFLMKGFEFPTIVAEEVRDARRTVPRVMAWTLLAAGAAWIYAALGVLLAVPAADSIANATSQNTYASATGAALGVSLGQEAAWISAVLMFIATFTAVTAFQLIASRTVWTLARDRQVPFERALVNVSGEDRVPRNAVIATGIVAAILPFLFTSQTSYVLVGASMPPLMLAFLVPVLGRIRAARRGTWRAGPWSLGRAGIPVATVAALAVVLIGVIAAMPHESLYGTDSIPYLAVVGLTVPFTFMPLIVLVLTLVTGGLLVRWAFRDGGFHTRNSWAVERDLHVRRTLRHAGTCSTCAAPLPAGTEVSFDPESKRIFCFACEFLD